MIVEIFPVNGVTQKKLISIIHQHLKKDALTWKLSDSEIVLKQRNGTETTTLAFDHVKAQYNSECVFFRESDEGVYMLCYPSDDENVIHMLSSKMIYTLTYNLSDYIDDITISL